MPEAIEKVVERLREESAELQRVAWGRSDGGQDACLGAALVDEAAALIESLSARNREMEEAAYVLSNALGTLIVATDGNETLRALRQTGLEAMRAFEAALFNNQEDVG